MQQESALSDGSTLPTQRAARVPSLVAVLQDDIESGLLPPGTALDERSLAGRFGVSRTPVREALKQLAATGLVSMTPHVGAQVARMSVAELRAMLEFVSELEPVCAKLAARRASRELRHSLEQSLLDCERVATQGGDYTVANSRFHDAIYEGCHNEFLVKQIRTARRILRRYRAHDFQSDSQIARSLSDHRLIAKAILAGDEQAAAQAMMAHLPAGNSGFSEFLARIPPRFFEGEPRAGRPAHDPVGASG